MSSSSLHLLNIPTKVCFLFVFIIIATKSLFYQTTSSDGNFIAVFSDELVTRGTALSYCENQIGTTLASIHSGDENDEAFEAAQYIASLHSSDGNFDGSYMIWIGLNDLLQNNIFTWPDGTNFVYQNWSQNPELTNNKEPNGNSQKSCVHMYASVIPDFGNNIGAWNDHGCNDMNFVGGSKSFICNAPIYNQVLSSDSNYIAVFTNDLLLTWTDALLYCENIIGSTLASIHSDDENDEAFEAAQYIANEESLDGNFDNSYMIWIGLNDLITDQIFEWSDGSDFDYTNWSENRNLTDNSEPNGIGNKLCVHMYGIVVTEFGNNLGEWNDHGCDAKDFQGGSKTFLCNAVIETEKPSNEPTEEPLIL